MADWKTSVFQIIPTPIGSGLTLFVFNNLIADINQPHIFLDVQEYDTNMKNIAYYEGFLSGCISGQGKDYFSCQKLTNVPIGGGFGGGSR